MSLVFDTSLYMNGGAGGGVSLDKIIVKSDTIPAAAAKYVGAVYQYVGDTNATYTHGYIYECVESGSTYAWERIDVQPGATRGRFLALWNCATGLAESNPPSSPYPYGAGDYYIVGTVGTTNYKPSGSSYVIGTASTTVETDDVAVNDTYYYDGTNWNLQKNTVTTVDQNYDPTSINAQSGTAVAQAIAGITIPTVNDATLTITQGGVSKGTFTANAGTDVTIALDSGVNIDNVTITENASNQLQASAVMNARTGTDALPIWQGTEQEWTNGKATDWYNWRTPLISNFTAGEDCVIDYNAFTALTTWYGNGALNGNISSQPSSFSNIELLIKCKIPSITPSLGSNNGLYGLTSLGFKSGTTSKYMGLYVYKNGSNYYFCTHADPDIASIIAPSSTSPLYNFAIDTWFWLKYTKTGNSFAFEYSINGIDWNTVGSTTYSFTVDTISSIYLTGNIMTSSGILYDLNECHVKIGDNIYWQPEVSQSQCYTLEAAPTTSSAVYSEPNTTSALTITSVGTGTITLSDNNTYSYTSSGDVTTYQTIGDAYPNYLANINGVGVKIGNTLIADYTNTSTFQTTTNLVTSVSSASTDTQYPSAKLLYDTVGNIEATLDAIIAQGSNS